MYRASAHAFAHPAFWISVALLLWNDQVLKARFPSFWTGKLSDFAGLFFTPFLVVPVLGLLLRPLRLPPPRIADLGFALTGAGFLAFKSSPAVHAAVVAGLSALLGRPAMLVLDPSDGIAVLALLPARWLWERIARATLEGRDPPRGRALAGWILAMAALLATPPCPPLSAVRRIVVQEERMYAGIISGTGGGPLAWLESADGGETWRWLAEPPAFLRAEPSELPRPITRCRPDALEICVRVPEPKRIELTRDGGRTWRALWTPPWGREGFQQRVLGFLKSAPGTCLSGAIDRGPYDLAFDPRGGRWIVAMGTEGLLTLNPDGSWQLRSVVQVEQLPEGYRRTIIRPIPYAAENLGDALWFTFGEARIAMAFAILIYFIRSRRSLRSLALQAGRSARSAFPNRKWIAILLIALIVPAALIVLMGIERIPVLIVGLLGFWFFSPPSVALWPLNGLILVLVLIAPIMIWRTEAAWRAMGRVAPHPAAVRAVHRAIIGSALGIFPGTWGFFIAWAMGWIPLYELAVALAAAWVVGLWIILLHWSAQAGREAPGPTV